MSKAWRAALLLGVVVLAFGVMGIMGHGARSRKALEQYEADLRAKGEKLTYVELMRLRIAHTNDSLARLTNAVASLRSGNQTLQPANLQTRKYVGAGQAQVAWQQENPFPQGSGSASPQANWQIFDAELADLAQPMAAIRQALRDPAADAGLRTNFATTLMPSFIAIRTAAQWLAGAALNEARQGRVEAALQNLEALAALGRTHREEYTLVAQMIRVAVVNLGLAATWEALQAPGWNDSQLERLQHAWEGADMVAALEKGFLG
ncbi:MAG TPA: hypothetical protein VNZ22_21030, partial [Bacillota bacterium]|nr:hypothetical protein [Bacillota bacterium]